MWNNYSSSMYKNQVTTHGLRLSNSSHLSSKACCCPILWHVRVYSNNSVHSIISFLTDALMTAPSNKQTINARATILNIVSVQCSKVMVMPSLDPVSVIWVVEWMANICRILSDMLYDTLNNNKMMNGVGKWMAA